MTTPTPAPVPGPLIEAITWDGLATILAALLATGIAIIGYSFQQSMARKERLAAIYSEALRAVEDYLEAPYLVGRRDGSSSARQNVTSTISEIQSRLSYYCALLEIHAPTQISSAYGDLVRVARSEAGPLMSAAWKAKPTRKDRDVPMGERFTRTESDHARRVFITEIQRSEGKRRG